MHLVISPEEVSQTRVLCPVARRRAEVDALAKARAIHARKVLDRVEATQKRKVQTQISGSRLMSDIIIAVSKASGIEREMIASDSRRLPIIRARFASIVIAKRTTKFSFSQIGKALGGKDHASISNAIRRGFHMLETSAEFAATIAAAEEILGVSND